MKETVLIVFTHQNAVLNFKLNNKYCQPTLGWTERSKKMEICLKFKQTIQIIQKTLKITKSGLKITEQGLNLLQPKKIASFSTLFHPLSKGTSL